MSLPAILKIASEIGGIDLALRGAKSIWANMPWAKDQKKRLAADAAADAFLINAEEYVRTLGDPGELETALNRLADTFERDLVSKGLTTSEAKDVRRTLEQQIEVRAIRPVREFRALAMDVERMQAEIVELGVRIASYQAALTLAAKRAERAYLGLGLAIGLAVAALGISLVAIVR